jgi:uncharacterized RDD family membrane protein YckC
VSGAAQGPGCLKTPTVKRRLAAFIYEGVLLFGVLMIAGIAYSASTGLRDPATQGTLGLQIFLFVILGLYFGWFWSHGGQTVAMKAWHIRLTNTLGGPVSMSRALMRYLLSWLWFAPALLAAYLSGLKSGGTYFGIVASGVLAYAALSRMSPERQFWHDVVCGTRLVDVRPVKPVPA